MSLQDLSIALKNSEQYFDVSRIISLYKQLLKEPWEATANVMDSNYPFNTDKRKLGFRLDKLEQDNKHCVRN
ncbi:hypothetical protein PR048_012663 [Dryococelus australis]|uniref:Uncharacterized protein n=1 Tax=Dryococelus australis TaxID=614101 RepID=A0ABQ9HQ25_9NEOP|nr:hypothetical protein PR048_012663 [Dryococelus australis]